MLIETSESLCRELLKEKVLVIKGDAKRQDMLRSAGMERARGVCHRNRQ
ncbi:MAG: NAD-binding protein [Candidatus Sulfotelmatobacter sp.]